MIQADIQEGVIVNPSLHIDVYSAQTGISRYLEVEGIRYDKTEDLTEFSAFDYVLTHDKEEVGNGFEVIGVEKCFTGIRWRELRIALDDCIYLMKRV